MNRDVLETNWTQVREFLRDKFSNLTEEDIRQINGRYDQLVAKLQQKYGYTRDEAEERIRNWNFERERGERYVREAPRATYAREGSARETRKGEEYDWSWLRWLAIGLPLLLLGAYLFTPAARVPQEPMMTQERLIIETPADRTISNGIRNFLITQQNMGLEMNNVLITSRNGVVTLSGTVSNAASRNAIEDAAANFAGVRQVINNLQIR
jgi:uncharacterized protein YjbJ (UPF0337 family)